MEEVEESNPWLAATLRARVGESAAVDPARIAEVLVSILCEVQAACVPIMGSRGVALLYRRSVFLTPSLQPPLARTPDDAAADAETHDADTNYDALRLMLSHQPGADAIASGAALLQTFYDLLVDLFGLALTERVLRSVWANHAGGDAAGDDDRS